MLLSLGKYFSILWCGERDYLWLTVAYHTGPSSRYLHGFHSIRDDVWLTYRNPLADIFLVWL